MVAENLARLKAQRIAVTGASGFIGRWVARKLSALGLRPSVLVRDVRATAQVFSRFEVHAELVQADLHNETSVQDAIAKVRPQLLFNLAGYGVDRSERDRERAEWINSALPEALAKAMLEHHEAPRVIHTGSALEYGRAPQVEETSAPQPFEQYGQTKLEGTLRLQALAQSTALEATTARLFTVYGPGEHDGRLLPTLMQAAEGQEEMALSEGSQKRDFTFVEEVADGLLALAAHKRCEPIVNMSTGELRTVRAFIEAVAKVFEIPSSRLKFGAIPARPEEMHHGPVPTQRLRALLGWSPQMSPEDGARRTLALRAQGVR